MSEWAYAIDSHIWPTVGSAGLIAFLGICIWGRRDIAGARPLAFAALFGVLWIIGLVMEGAAVVPSTKIFWFEFQGVWQLPLATAIFFFVLAYAGLGRWLTRRNALLLSIPSLLVTAIIFTNGLHHLMWQSFQVDGAVTAPRGGAYWATLLFAIILALIGFLALGRLFIRSPRHRWPVALIIFGQVANRVFVVLDSQKLNLPGSVNPIAVMFGVAFVIYSVALFRFHILDPIPLARVAVLDQMREGMLVLDTEGRIVDFNKSAKAILGKAGIKLKGRLIDNVLTLKQISLPQPNKTEIHQAEITIGDGPDNRHYNLSLTPLSDRGGELLGQILLLHDVTQEKRTQASLLDQQRVVALLGERDRLARELHDGIAQVVGYMGIQAQTVRKLVNEGNIDKADIILGRLADVAKDAHADIRESILNLRSNSDQEWSFVPALKQYLGNFEANYGVHTDLHIAETQEERSVQPIAGVQLLRVIQEALTNSRKHGNAQNIRLTIQVNDGEVLIDVADDGSGFDVKQLEQLSGSHLGLAFMRERMQAIGGTLAVDSSPGIGTIIKLKAPMTA